MATATTKTGAITFVLELSEAEARYVHAALWRSSPTEFEDDTPWDALDDAMREAGVAPDRYAAAD